MDPKEGTTAESNPKSMAPTGGNPNPSGPFAPEADAIVPAQEILAVKRDIASLKRQAEKRHKPWYLDYSKTIPILISVVTVLVSIYSQRAEDVQKSLETLSEITGQLVDIRKEYTEKMASGGDPTFLQAESTLLNQKKLALQEKARVILQDPKVYTKVNSSEIRILATELGNSGEVKEAEELLKSDLARLDVLGKAFKNKQGEDALERAYVLAALAYWEMVNDRTFDAIKTARGRMQEAVNIIAEHGGEYSKESLVQIYITWSTQELVVGDADRSQKELDKAQDALKSLSPLNLDRNSLSTQYLSQQRYIQSASKAHPLFEAKSQDPTDWYGSWNISFDTPQHRHGLLTLSWNKQTNAVEARVELFDSAKLVEQYAGTGPGPLGPSLRIDWLQIWRINPQAQPQAALGYSLFTLNGHSALRVSNYLLGESTTQGSARKAS